MMEIPVIATFTPEERRAYIKDRFPCISDCDMCGLCKVFHGQDAEVAFRDYIEGKRDFMEVFSDYK